ncbi:MAG: universal stress protein [Pseudomonadota bacterium]
MTTPLRILASTDLSAPSRHAMDRAFRLAAETGAQLTLMHAVQQSAIEALQKLLGQDGTEVVERIRAQAHEALSQLAADLGQACGISAAIHLAAGNVPHVIVEYADTIDADLLVIGSQGEGFLRHLLFGTTASRLLRLTRRPMLLVRQAPHESYRRILVPVDFSPVSVAALRLVRALAPQAHIVLLHAFEAPFEGKLAYAGVSKEVISHYRSSMRLEALQQLRSLTATADLAPEEATLLALHGDASQHILEQEQEQDCDLIVMGKHGADMIEDFLLGSITKHVLLSSQGDVLVTA